MRAPWISKFFQFHAVFGKFWQNRMLVPPGELAPPPLGNPGSDHCFINNNCERRKEETHRWIN